jgi:hypothetical protein
MWALRAAAAGSLALLAGCSWLPFGHKEPPVACPTTTILRPLAQTALFNKTGTGLRPTDVAFYGILSEVDPKCSGDANTLHAALDVIIAAERGAASRGDTVPLTYFIGIVGPDEQILGKQSFAVTVQIPEDAKRGGVTDHIEEAIPLNGRRAADLSLVFGFQQSPEAIDFYQHFRGR